MNRKHQLNNNKNSRKEQFSKLSMVEDSKNATILRKHHKPHCGERFVSAHSSRMQVSSESILWNSALLSFHCQNISCTRKWPVIDLRRSLVGTLQKVRIIFESTIVFWMSKFEIQIATLFFWLAIHSKEGRENG